METAAIDTAAFLGCLVPGGWAFQIVLPKRPHSALAWTDRVNHTSFLAIALLQKYAIFSAWLFNNRCPKPDTLEILLAHLPGFNLQEISDEFNLRRSYPDITFIRPGAASAALHTLKMQTTNIPRNFSLSFRHRLRRINTVYFLFNQSAIVFTNSFPL